MKFRSSDVFGSRALQDRCRMLHKGKLVVMVEEEDVEKKRCKQQARASMGPADKLPANHKVKAASLKAFEELRNASANRKSSLPHFSILRRRRRRRRRRRLLACFCFLLVSFHGWVMICCCCAPPHQVIPVPRAA
jgi:hypothetical protein